MDGPLVFGLSNGKDNNYGMILHIIFAFSMENKKRENTANQSSISNYLSLLNIISDEIWNTKVELCDESHRYQV